MKKKLVLSFWFDQMFFSFPSTHVTTFGTKLIKWFSIQRKIASRRAKTRRHELTK